MQALRSRKLLHSSGGLCVPKGGGTNSSNSNNKRGGSSMMHSMLTLQLDSYTADGTLLQRNTLAFVELAAPEPKVGVHGCGCRARSFLVFTQGTAVCSCYCHRQGTALQTPKVEVDMWACSNRKAAR